MLPPSATGYGPPATAVGGALSTTVTARENSEVLPAGSVAVAVMKWPIGTTVGKNTEKLPFPLPVGRDSGRTQEGLALAETSRIGSHIGKQFDRERCIRSTVESSLNRCAATKPGGSQYGKVLQVVGAGV